MSDWANYIRGFTPSDSNYRNHGKPRMPKALNVFTVPHAILGVDGQVLMIRHYPPMAPKDLKTSVMVPIPEGIKVTPGMFYRDGEFK